MTKEIGTSAGLLAFLGLLVHMQIPHSESGVSGDRLGGSPGATSKKSSDAEKRTNTEPVEGPWLATRSFFNTPRSSRQPHQPLPGLLVHLTQPESEPASHKDKEVKKDEDLDLLLGLPRPPPEDPKRKAWFSIVATVADPSHTHLSLFLDGETEAIERSVQAVGWQFAQQWLPWVDYFDGNQPDIDERRAQRRMQLEQEELPGILVFRGNDRSMDPSISDAKLKDKVRFGDRALFVFLVPETVTGGINGRAFHVAMHLAKALSPANNIGVLAPSFSGSFASLAKLAKQWKTSINPIVYSGSASNLTYVKAFQNESPGLTFHSGVLDSGSYQHAACDILTKYDMNQRGRKIAVLKEDEGGFQQSLLGANGKDSEYWIDSNGHKCLIEAYVFPRDISHLRNAYQEVSGNEAQNPYSDQPARLNFTIRDPNRGEDSIPTFSEMQTPLTQDAQLSSIMGELNRSHTRAVLISATNRLDALFILRALRVACPDIRVFIDGPDILFVTAADREALAGTVFLSSYPMSFEGDRWLDPEPDGDRLVFTESTLQGLYNVAQLLLKTMGATTGTLMLHGYRQPGLDYPGVWALTLNRYGFFPLDLVRNVNPNNWFEPNPTADAKGKPLPTAVEWLPPRNWIFTVFSLFVATLFCCGVFLWSNLSRSGRPIWLCLTDNYASKLGALLTICLSLSALMCFIALPWWNTPFSISDGLRMLALRIFVLFGVLAPIGTLALAVHMALRRSLNKSSMELVNWRYLGYCVLPLVVFAFAAIQWNRLCIRPDTGLFFRFRSLELYSGSSPAPPFLFACLIFCSFAIFQLRRYGLAGATRARLQINPGTDRYREGLRVTYEDIERRIGSPWTLNGSAWMLRAVPGVLFVGLCVVILGRTSLSAFELPQYNKLLFATIALILFCLATNSHDLVNVWRGVRDFLNLIQIHPQRRKLHDAIQRISNDWPKRTIWNFNRIISNSSVEREMLYRPDWRAGVSAKTMTASAGGGGSSEAHRATPLEDARQFRELVLDAGSDTTGVNRMHAIERLHVRSAELAGAIYEHDLNWGDPNDPGPQTAGKKELAGYCEDFVALQFCQYVVYAVDQIKRIAFSLSLGFVLLMLLFNSYNPGSPQLVTHLLVAIFVLIGILVWRVFSHLERDPVLSLIANNGVGQLSGEFWVQLAALGSLPLLGLVGHLFPSLAQFLFQWIAPSVQQLH